MRVLIAPDKFRGTLTATQAAHAVASGWLRARPGDTVVEVPMADGGEGTDHIVQHAGRQSYCDQTPAGAYRDPAPLTLARRSRG